MYGHRAAVIVNDVLDASGLFLHRFLGAKESIYWRTFVVFWWLDYFELGYDLGLMG
jgi:hypothetical protein